MSNTPIQDLPAQEPPAQELSSGSGQTLPSRPFQPISDPSASKKVCFYKSGDYKFSGHRMVINARTFKTFDALLDALSKKVPLPFGVRTITTPRGTRLVKALDDLHDGGSYVCSDQRRVKPLNLEEVNRRQVPWNTTRPFSAGRRRQFGRRNEVTNRPAKVTERAAVRTPKKLLVIKNRDPTLKRTIVLQRRTAPTFDALLDYLSQILQFPVLKLFSTDGRRVDGLAALILCSGVVVAAGNEPFRLGNYNFHRTGQMAQAVYMDTVEPSMLQPRAQNNKSLSSGRGSRNFSLSSERFIVDRINKSRNGSMNSQLHHHNKSFETEANHRHTSVETCGTGRVANEHHACIVPQDDDIEKSFRVNQDGSMTVEMKVHLTIKEEEVLHWTTTLSRSSLSKRTLCASISESGNSSPDANNAIAKDSSSISEDETKEENRSAGAGKGVVFSDGQVYQGYASTALGKSKAGFRRTPTPGPRHVNKRASVESVKTVTETGVQESTLGHYSYMERTADGETTEGYCVVRHSSSSHRPIPKPRKTASAGATKKGSHSSVRSTGVAEVLQIQNNGMEVTETVMHIYESQGCYDNYDSVPLHGSTRAPDSKPSTVSSSNDCDIDFSTTDSLQRQKEEMLSLSSEPISPTHDITNNLSAVTENEARIATNSQGKGTVIKDKTLKGEKKKNPARSQKNSTSTSGSDKKQKESTINPSKHSKRSSSDKLSSNASMGKKSLSSSESVKSGQKPQIKRLSKDEKMPRKEQALLANTENLKRTPSQRQNLSKAAARDNGHNVNTPTGRPPMKKNMVGILPPKKTILPGKKTISKPKSMIENRISSPKKAPELSESLSMPSLNPSPSEIHQYVENWLEKVSPDPVPYTEESEPRTKVVFKIGGDSESDEKTDEHSPSPGDAIKKSPSCLSVPLCHTEPTSALLQNEQYARGLCVSMPSVRVDPMHQENRLRAHKSAEAIVPADDESSSSNILSPKEKIKPALRQLCSSIQCIRRASDTTTSNLEKSNSLPDFPTQVASVFGSSCKAFLSFLSVMTLRDSLAGSALEDQSRSTSEAMLMMESLQKISAIEDEEEQRASLTDLQSRASSQLRERWKDFQILRERLESEPLSPRVSETEFALDVLSEGGDVFEDQHMVIDELMEELNMPQDLREQISSTIHQARSFYPVEESTFVETERAQSDSEEDVEKFVEECDECIAEVITQTEQGDDDKEQAKMIDQLEQEEKVQETSNDVKESQISQTERDEPLEDKENEEEEQVEEVEEGMTDREDGDTKVIEEDDGEVTETEEREREEEAEEELATEEKIQEEWEAEKGSKEEEEGIVEEVEEGTEEEMTVDGEEDGEELEEVGEKEVVEETDVGLMDEEDQEARVDDSVEETDEREGAEETEEEKGEDEIDEEVDEEENGVKKGEEAEEEAEAVIEETDEGEEEDNVIGEVLQEEEEDEEAAVEEDAAEGIEENEEEETTEVIEEKDEAENIIEKDEEEEEEEEADELTVDVEEEDTDENEEEEVTEVIEGKDEAEEQEEEEEQADELTVDVEEEHIDENEEEEVTEVIEGKDEVENMIEEQEEEEEQSDELTVDVEEDDIDENEEEEVTEVIEGKDEAEEQEEEEEQTDELTVDVEEEDIDENEEEEVTEVTGGKDEVENMIEEQENGEEEAEEFTVEGEEEDTEENEEEEVTEVIEGKDEVENMIEEEEEDEGEADALTMEAEEEGEEGVKENEEEDMTEVVEEKDEVENIIEEMEEEEEETVVVTEIVVEDEVIEEEEEEENEDKTEVVSEENKEEEEEREQEDEVEDVKVENIKEVITDEEEQETEQEGKCDEGEESGKELEKTENSLEEFVEEEVVIEEMEIEENLKAGQTLDEEEEREDDEENDGSEQVEEQESKDEEEEENVSDDADSIAGKNLLEEALYLQQQSSCEEEANVNTKASERDTESPTKYSSEGQCEDEKGNGTDTANETDEERSSSLPHPVEISQELLDFVNSALQSSSLIFTYDAQGNLRIEPDNARVIQTKQTVIPKRKEDSSYGLKRLPSPSTSELSDYRPETSESGGYKSQDSVDIVSESGEETSLKPSPFRRCKIPNGRVNSELSVASNSEAPQKLKSRGSMSSSESGTKASREDLSYFSAASSQKADAEATQCISFDSADGVLIDQGRWLLKENHLIRKSPPVSLGMYGNADSTSIENTSEDSPPHYKTQHSPLAALSSSELEEMAKPQTPKCTYYNMPHGSDSDPFLDDSSYKSGKKDSSSVKGRGFRVSPTIDTTKTWASKNGSMSSFASVEFKMTDRKVHPEGESSAVTQARRTSSGGAGVLRAQDSLETLHVRCGQYCPIL